MAACENCVPIGLERVAAVLGITHSYALKLAGDSDSWLPTPAGLMGKQRYWWLEDIEALAEQRRTPGA